MISIVTRIIKIAFVIFLIATLPFYILKYSIYTILVVFTSLVNNIFLHISLINFSTKKSFTETFSCVFLLLCYIFVTFNFISSLFYLSMFFCFFINFLKSLCLQGLNLSSFLLKYLYLGKNKGLNTRFP